jgi:hypothetical protein
MSEERPTKVRSHTPLHPLAFARVGKTPFDGRDKSQRAPKSEPRRASSANRSVRTPKKASSSPADTTYGVPSVAAKVSEVSHKVLDQSSDPYIYYSRGLDHQRVPNIQPENERLREACEMKVHDNFLNHGSHHDIEKDPASARSDDGTNASPPLQPKIKQFLQWKAQRSSNPKVSRRK